MVVELCLSVFVFGSRCFLTIRYGNVLDGMHKSKISKTNNSREGKDSYVLCRKGCWHGHCDLSCCDLYC